jgi:hypothetical protein
MLVLVVLKVANISLRNQHAQCVVLREFGKYVSFTVFWFVELVSICNFLKNGKNFEFETHSLVHCSFSNFMHENYILVKSQCFAPRF